MFYFSLFLNTIKLSIYQQEKSIEDLYYLFVGPFVFIYPIYISEHLKPINIYRFTRINIEYLFYILFPVYIAIKIYISTIMGWRAFVLEDSTYLQSNEEFSVPGFSGLAGILQWTLLILTPAVKVKWRLLFSIALIIFSILQVSRGDIMRMLSFYLIWYIIELINFKKKSVLFMMKRLVIFVCFILIIFTFLGNIRQEARGSGSDDLIYNLGFKTDNIYLAWIYSYFAINFDVLKLYYIQPAIYEFQALKVTFYGGDPIIHDLDINGFNAATFLRTFIVDFKELFFIELFIYGIIVSLLVLVAKSMNNKALYYYICMIMFFSSYGNYFQIRAFFMAILLFIFFNMFFEYKRVGVKKGSIENVSS